MSEDADSDAILKWLGYSREDTVKTFRFHGGILTDAMERPTIIAYEHTPGCMTRLDGQDTQTAISRSLAWSATTPAWATNWVPEFSAWDAEVAARSWGVILDESRLVLPEEQHGA